MPDLALPFFDFLLPALVALGVLLFAWRRREGPASEGPDRGAPRTTSGTASSARALGAVAFGAALLAAWWSVFGEFAVPSASRVLAAKDWIPWSIVAAIATAGLARFERARRIVPSGGAPLVLSLLVLLAMRTRISAGGSGILHALLVFLVAMATWTALELSSERLRGPLPSLVLALAAAGSAVALALSGDTALGRLCGSLSAVSVASAFVARQRRVFTLSGGPVAIVSVVLIGSWTSTWISQTTPLSSIVLLWAAVAVPSAAGIGPLSTWPATRREIARVALTLALALAGVWIAFQARPGTHGY
ncbi:MAG: hypothetical protein HZA53_19375 [Planctomycetes bacterium]|nr:hypothetical protein [Planctomycetota bacterium]